MNRPMSETELGARNPGRLALPGRERLLAGPIGSSGLMPPSLVQPKLKHLYQKLLDERKHQNARL